MAGPGGTFNPDSSGLWVPQLVSYSEICARFARMFSEQKLLWLRPIKKADALVLQR